MARTQCVIRGSAAAAVMTLAACAAMPPPVAQLSAARASIEQAQPAASRHAPGELQTAQAKLTRAEEAMARQDYEEALRFAEQAEVDARLAQATADAERMRSALAEVNEGIRRLKQQLEGKTP